MLIGPEERAIEIVDEAIAIRADDRHVARCVQQARLHLSAVAQLGLGLEKTCGKADSAARAHLPKLRDGGNGGVAVDADKDRIGHAGQGG